jgi:ABC-type transport system involved in cytochrome c biogenesis permease subunit
LTLPFLLYLAAAALYAVHFARRTQASGHLATTLLVAGILAHTFVLGMHTVRVGHAPVVGLAGAVSAFVWLLALTYLYVELTTNERAMGTIVAPLLALLCVIPLTSQAPAGRPAVLDSPLFVLHISSMLFAYAAFALACVVSLTYVLLFRELKRKQPGVFFARLPSLAALDQMNVRAVTIGLLFLTIGVAVGAIWVVQARGYAPDDPRVQAMSLGDPKIFLALLSWLLYAFQLYARRAIGWSGRRAAWLSTIGFASVLLNFLPVAYFVRTSHAFD